MLNEYRAKRDFARTPEPDDVGSAEASGPLRFSIQRHSARRLHYDLRLECDGVLKSWAIPKGPSLNPADKRLAVRTEDHPLAYIDFEGSIPNGEYGAGEVVVWDAGFYSPDDEGDVWFHDREEANRRAREGIERGKLSFTLRGAKLGGSFALVRTRKEEDQWLLIKHADAFATSARDVTEDARSVRSGRTNEQIARGTPAASPEGVPGAVRRPPPTMLAPMVPTEVASPFTNPSWGFELKLDGIRAIAVKQGQSVRILSRNGKDVTQKFPMLADEIQGLAAETLVLDGEIVLFDDDGRPSFQGLMQRFQLAAGAQLRQMDAKVPIDYCVFDLLHVDGWDLRGCAFSDRRALLERLDPRGVSIRVLDLYPEEGELLYAQAAKLGLEGIVGKRLDSRYQDGARSRAWIKVKGYHTEEFLIGGFTRGEGARNHSFGALLLGRVDEAGKLRFCGSVGGGFSDVQLATVVERLRPLITDACPFDTTVVSKGEPTWIEPRLWAEVRFMAWTKQGLLRFPVFKRLRPDLEATSGIPVAAALGSTAGDEADAVLEQLLAPGDEVRLTIDGHPIKLTSLAKVLWPATERSPAVTKRDLIGYYARVSEALLAHLRDRPIAFVRYPEGLGGESFFQKHWEKGLPEFVKIASIYSAHSGRAREFILCDNLATLIWLGQLSALEIHPWYSRVSAEPDAHGLSAEFADSEEALEDSVLNFPDFLVVDLDPNVKLEGGGEALWRPDAWARVVRVAEAVKETLDAIGLRGYPKTSGKTGLHIYVPLKRVYDYAAVRAAAETLGRHVMARLPEDVTMEWSVAKRPEKVFFDHNQNVRGKTLAAPYSPRPAPGAPVSFPVRWERLREIEPAQFDVFTAPSYLADQGDLWHEILLDRQTFGR